MSKKTKAKAYLTSSEVKYKMKNTIGFWRVQKWLIIYNALNFEKSAEEIAQCIAVKTSFVYKTISAYNRIGPAAIETVGKGGRRHAYFTIEEECDFMEGFISRAQKGSIATAGEIKKAFELRLGEEVDPSTIYRLLERHGWRKIVPLPYHPKKDKQAQEVFKKTLVTK